MAGYEVLLSGKPLEGFERDQVFSELKRLFKLSTEKTQVLLGGKPRVVKKNLTKDAAVKLRDDLNRIGAQAAMREMKASTDTSHQPRGPKTAGGMSGLSLVDDRPKPDAVEAQPATPATFSCPKCGVEQARADTCSSCGVIIEKYLAIKERRANPDQRSVKPGVGRVADVPEVRFALPWYGAAAGLAGAALWTLIAYSFGLEIGFLAWAIGGAVGFGAVINNPYGGTAVGVTAAVIASLAILGGKFATMQLYLEDELGADSGWQELMVAGLEDEQTVISYLAYEVAEEYESQGRELQWPEWSEQGGGYEEADFPEGIWQEAADRWEAMVPIERSEYRDSLANKFAQLLDESGTEIAAQGVFDTFGIIDLVFFFLGMGTAFQIASRGR